MRMGGAVVGLLCLFAPHIVLAAASDSAEGLAGAVRGATAPAQGGVSGRFRVSAGAAFGSTRDADSRLSDSGLGLLVRLDVRMGKGRLGLEYGIHHLTGTDPRRLGDVPARGLDTVPLRTDHLLFGYELAVGNRFFVRPALGFARHRFIVAAPIAVPFAARESSEVGVAVGVTFGAFVTRWGSTDVRVEGFWRHSAGEDSTGSRRLLAVQLVLVLPIG